MSNCTPQSRAPVKFAENLKVEKIDQISMPTLVEDSQQNVHFVQKTDLYKSCLLDMQHKEMANFDF